MMDGMLLFSARWGTSFLGGSAHRWTSWEDGGPVIQPEMGFDLMTDSDLWILFTG